MSLLQVAGQPLEVAVSFICSEMVVLLGLSDSTGSSSSTGQSSLAHASEQPIVVRRPMPITTVHLLQRFPLQLPRWSGLLQKRSKPRARWSACHLPKQRTLREPRLRGSAPPRSGERLVFLAENPESCSYHLGFTSQFRDSHRHMFLIVDFVEDLDVLLDAGTLPLTSLRFHAPTNRFVAKHGWVREM